MSSLRTKSLIIIQVFRWIMNSIHNDCVRRWGLEIKLNRGFAFEWIDKSACPSAAIGEFSCDNQELETNPHSLALNLLSARSWQWTEWEYRGLMNIHDLYNKKTAKRKNEGRCS